MKLTKKVLGLIVIFGMVFTSCSDDDNDDNSGISQDALAGKWNLSGIVLEEVDDADVYYDVYTVSGYRNWYEFGADGTMRTGEEGATEADIETGTWTLNSSGTLLTTVYEDGLSYIFEIEEIDENEGAKLTLDVENYYFVDLGIDIDAFNTTFGTNYTETNHPDFVDMKIAYTKE